MPSLVANTSALEHMHNVHAQHSAGFMGLLFVGRGGGLIGVWERSLIFIQNWQTQKKGEPLDKGVKFNN